MNIRDANAEQPQELRWLVIDFNSYFAACEQQERPELRGRPIAVAPMMAETTCAIAASYPAKAYGVKTGTIIAEARRLCPDLIVVPARPKLYVQYHHRLLDAIESCIPIDDVMSIDEVACRLDPTQRTSKTSSALAYRIKQAIRDRVGACLTSSVGVASNRLLAKLASDMQKPDGLTILRPEHLPGSILHLEPAAICGIGRNMTLRLRAFGIDTMEKLWRADRQLLRRVWGGIGGARFHALLHGEDLPSPEHPRRSVGHQHVLAPEQRNRETAILVLRQLLARAAERLRREEFYCRRLAVDIKWMPGLGYWVAERKFSETQDTVALMRIFSVLQKEIPPLKPLRVGVTLADLAPAAQHQPDLFAPRLEGSLAQAVDKLNTKYGKGTVSFGATPESFRRMTSKIAFHRVPDIREF